MAVQRTQRLNELVKRILSTIIQREYSIDKMGLITLSRVVVSKDMQHARVFFTVLGSEEKEKKALETLKADQKKLRTTLAHSITLRYIPELIFEIDTDLKKTLRVDSIIDAAHDVTEAHEKYLQEKEDDGEE